MTLSDAADQLKKVGAAWGTISKNTAQATSGITAFAKEIAAPAGVIYAFQKLAASRRDLILKKDDADKLLPSNRLKSIVNEMNAIDKKLTPLQAKLATFAANGVFTDKDREAREKVRDKANPLFDRSDELQQEYHDLRKLVPQENFFSGLNDGLKKVEIGWLAAGTVAQQTSHRWYGFNDAVKATNVSLGDRNALFAIATNQEIRYGKNLTDIAQILDVTRESGIALSASMDPLRRKLGQLTMGNLASSLDEVVHLSLQAEDALGLTPEVIRNVIDASIQLNRPYQEVLDTITNINQGLGLTGEQSAKIVSQVAGQAFGFNIKGDAVEAVAKQVARLQAASRGLPVDSDFATRITGNISDISSKSGGLSTAMGGGRNVLQDPKALMRSWEFMADFLRPFQSTVVFKQMAEQLQLSATDAQALIKVVDRMRAGFRDAALTGDTTAKVAENQLQRSGRVWGTFWNQLKGGALLGLTIFNWPLDKLTQSITYLHKVMGAMSESAKTAIKAISGVTAGLVLLAGAAETLKGLKLLAGAFNALNKSGWLITLLNKIPKGVGGAILPFLKDLAISARFYLGSIASFVTSVAIPAVSGIARMLVTTFVSTLTTGFSTVVSVAGSLVSAFISALTAGVTAIGTFITGSLIGGLIAIAAGSYLVYKVATALGLGKLGTIIGDHLWKSWQVVESVAVRVGDGVKNWFTELLNWISDHIPGLGFLHSKDGGISTHTLSKTGVLNAQLSASQNAFGAQNLTVASGSSFLSSQRRELIAALNAGTITPQTAKEVEANDAKELTKRINSIVHTLAEKRDLPAAQAKEQKEIMETMVALLARLTATADKDISTYTRQYNDSQRAADIRLSASREEAFKNRASMSLAPSSTPAYSA